MLPGSMEWDCCVPAPVENLDEGDACLVTGRYGLGVIPWRTSLRALLVRRKLLARARRAPSFQDLILDATVVLFFGSRARTAAMKDERSGERQRDEREERVFVEQNKTRETTHNRRNPNRQKCPRYSLV